MGVWLVVVEANDVSKIARFKVWGLGNLLVSIDFSWDLVAQRLFDLQAVAVDGLFC